MQRNFKTAIATIDFCLDDFAWLANSCYPKITSFYTSP